MNLRKQLATKNDCYKAGTKRKSTKGIFWHSTGANNPNLKRYVQPDDGALGKNIYGNSWNRSGLAKCCHAFIGKLANGKIATYQILPWDMRGWHAGTGTKGSANNDYIGFEICEDAKTDKDYAMKVYQEAVELTAYLCKMYKLNPLGKDVIIDHAEGHRLGIASNHGDVRHWLGKYGITLDKMRKDIKAEMDKADPKPTPPPPPSEGELYRLEAGASIMKEVPKELDKAGTYTIVEKQGNYGMLKSGAGWIDLREAEKRDATPAPTPTPAPTIKVGSKVKIKQGTRTYDDKSGLASWVYNEILIVQRIESDRVWVGFEEKGDTTATVNVANLILQ